MDHNQRTSKTRSQDLQKATKQVEVSQAAMSSAQSSLTSAAVPGIVDVQVVNADIFRQQYAGAVPLSQKGGAPQASNAGSTHVKIQRGTNFYQASIPGQVMMLKTERDETLAPPGEAMSTPVHTTKSSSLSRDISPSRITAQVVSAMSESNNQQPLLLSALTGKLPTSLMLATKPDVGQDRGKVVGNLRPVPFTAVERRHSPLAVGGSQSDSKGGKQLSAVTSLPFENLMRAAALVQAQEVEGRSSPGRLSVGAFAGQQGSMNQSGEGRRSKTPSPKPAMTTSTSSPQRQQGQGKRRSPMRSGLVSQPSPAPSTGQEVLTIAGAASMSGGVMIPVQQMGLVQQHLLAASLTSASNTTTTTTTPSSQTRPPPTGATLSQQQPTIPAAPGVPSIPQAVTMKLTTIPTDATALQKVKGGKNSHVISVGTGTDVRRYTSYAAQTKVAANAATGTAEGAKVKAEEVPAGRVFKLHKREEGPAIVAAERARGPGPAPSFPPSRGGGAEKKRVSPVPVAVSSSSCDSGLFTMVVTCTASKPFTTLSSFSALPSAAEVGVSQAGETRKRHHPLPTAAHGNKPITVPSCHSHVHVHQPSSLPRPHVPVSSTCVVAPPASCVTTTTLTQPAVSASRMSTPTLSSHLNSDTLRVKVEPRVAVSMSSMSPKYQPHHHRYLERSQPPQTITSQTVKSGPVVKDFVPVVGPPDPPPYRTPPSHINPFTFPTSGVRVHYGSRDKPAYSLIDQDGDGRVTDRVENKTVDKADVRLSTSHKSVSDLSTFRQAPLIDRSDEMPRLTPERTITGKVEVSVNHDRLFNHVEPQAVEGKDQVSHMQMSPFNQRLQNLNNFPSMATSYRSAYRSQSVAMQRAKAGIIMSSAKSLDLLRQNLQKIINKELNGIVQKYVEKFFKPAADNIRLNNGGDSVSEEHVNTVCRQIFEEAKRMYTHEARRSVTPISDFPDNVSESGSLNGKRISPNPLSKRFKASDSDSEKGSDGGLPKKVPRRKGRPPLNSSGKSAPLKPVVKLDNVKREGPKWDPERIKPETLFIMGARANKALGLGNTRGRLYIRHPNVFKYSGDQEDKVWLHEQKLMPATGGKAYMLIVEDIIDLSKTEEYRESPTLLMHECRGFVVPDWMSVKIKESMRVLSSEGAKRSRSRSPLTERPEPPKSLPFSNFSDTTSNNDVDSVGNKNSLQPSPVDAEEIEFLSAVDNDDTQPSDISAFNMTGGFDDTPSRSPCPLDSVEEDPPLAPPLT